MMTRRVFLFVIACLVFFVWILTDKLLLSVDGGQQSAAPTTFIRAASNTDERGILTVMSGYPHPIIIATVRGYADNTFCREDFHLREERGSVDDNRGDLAKITILSGSKDSSTPDEQGASLIQVGNPERITNNSTIGTASADDSMWMTKFRLDVAAPHYLPTDVVNCYTVDYRVEYVDAESALADFPSNSCSFRGTPRFRRIWRSNEFTNVHDREQPNAGVNWIVRNTADKDWQWTGVAHNLDSSNCPSWKQERPYSIVIIGDSQPSYTCNHLLYGLTGDKNASRHPKVRCVQIKQTLQNRTTFDRYMSELQRSREDYVIFNPSGLWEAAYGSLNVFRDNFQRLLSSIPIEKKNTQSKYSRQYFLLAPTTAVHPINYPDLSTDDKKWSMTQSRVQAINTVAKELVMTKKRMHESNSYDSVFMSTLPVPWDFISLSREDDPMTPTDMVSYCRYILVRSKMSF
jgi:hypothetical protein